MTLIKGTIRNVYGSYTLCASSYGSHRWFAVHEGKEAHPINACWFALTEKRLRELRELGISSDGLRRFFERKTDLVNAINGE